MLRGRLSFTPRANPLSGEIDGYDFEGPTRFDKPFTGIAVERPKGLVAGDIAGCEDIGPEDTGDTDYGLLLDRAYGKDAKGVTSPMPASWNQIVAWLKQIDAVRLAA